MSLLENSEKRGVLRQLARCLASLPNLSTLHLVSCTHQRAELQKAFKNKVYPSIQNLVLPANAYPIVLCCFALRDIHVRPCHNDGPMHCWQQLLLALAANCPYVETITGLILSPIQCNGIRRESCAVAVLHFAILLLYQVKPRNHHMQIACRRCLRFSLPDICTYS